ncbi:plasmid maintenance protein [Borrelia miyamotoi]|uniref:Plasmid maintenance protein n=1 Tax=Borrelia miyamotoi TaxID=47466 RepID=A0AAQ3AGN3_9SPIR|nr:plasmid maintenance protein [Borrelia miyamotoi]AOW96400.1 peptide transporter [Borrelia miyamotoi]WAZ85718.1 plasmid maintenance protein [Borrelia miyamotoi]WAZ91500.1 plasmid maintenance protein [Borrelia miyamotoi]WAZ92788.1 plasmid maintenance protein [Borrelia miyamotoi]WAZ94079.1 plasmid maintenance protein [Borrelia miyamotoi]
MKITKSIKGKTNRYQYNLIVLISTLNFMNLKLKKYTQNNILYFFNGNLKRNKQKTVKIKTLQNYLYELEKKFRITHNYCKHLGKKCGSEVYYTLQYSKKECHKKINSHFKNIKIEKANKFKERVKIHSKENGSPKWECINNINNNKRERDILTKYIDKCNFKIDLPLDLLNLRIEKTEKIELIKEIKRYEKTIRLLSDKDLNLIRKELKQSSKNGSIKNFLESKGYLDKQTQNNKQNIKLIKLKETLDITEAELKKQNYDEDVLRKEIKKIYEIYKEKPHFITERDKYKDLDILIRKIKVNTNLCKEQERGKSDIKNNIFSILLEQLRHKIDISILIPALKNFINAKDELRYSKVVDNTYYYELLKTIE